MLQKSKHYNIMMISSTSSDFCSSHYHGTNPLATALALSLAEGLIQYYLYGVWLWQEDG